MSNASNTVLFPLPFGPVRTVSGANPSSLPLLMPRRFSISTD